MEKKERKSYHGFPLSASVTLIYVLSGLTWVLLSDTILELLMVSKTELTTFQVLKGWFFVLTTGVILFFLLNRYTRKIHEGEERFRKTVEEVKDYAIYILDTEGNIKTWNKGAECLKEYSAEEIMGRHYSVFYSENDRQNRVPEKQLKIAAERGKYVTEGLRFKKNGTSFYAHVTITALKNNHKEVTGYIKIVHDISERKLIEERLLLNQEQIRRLLEHLEYIREEERISISREIHDELGQMLTSLKIELSFLTRELTRDDNSLLNKHIAGMKEKIDSLITTVRRIAFDLRTGEIDYLGLEAAIEMELMSVKDRMKIQISFKSCLNNMEIKNKKTSFAIYRIFQEALTNILRHSGATIINVNLLTDSGNNFILKIEDNGRGFEPGNLSNKSFGLLGMKERTAMMGGKLNIRSSPGSGCKILLLIPAEKLKNQ
ncbi:MAG: PAS domain-containing sensor histidine kinase [Ignavibacteriaceae bacterium]